MDTTLQKNAPTVKSDKKVIIFYILLALIPAFFLFAQYIVGFIDLDGMAEAFVTAMENKTATVFLCPSSILVAPIDLLFTLVPILLIKLARIIFFKDKRFTYAAIGAFLAFEVIIRNPVNTMYSILKNLSMVNTADAIQPVFDFFLVCLAPVIISLFFYSGHKKADRRISKRPALKLTFLGFATTALPIVAYIIFSVISVFLSSFIRNKYYYVNEDIYFAYSSVIINLIDFIIPLYMLFFLIFCSFVLKDLRCGLIGLAGFYIPFRIISAIVSLLQRIAYAYYADFYGRYSEYSLISSVLSIIMLIIIPLFALLYFIIKILVPEIKMRKKMKADNIMAEAINEDMPVDMSFDF